MVKCKCGPVVAPFVGLPEESLKGLLGTLNTLVGPTRPIICPRETVCPTRTGMLGETCR